MKNSILPLAALLSAAISGGQPAAADMDLDALQQAMTGPERPAADKERDASRRAPQVLDFLGLEPGMTVLDIYAAAGWYTEVLSYAVGEDGKVYMQNRRGERYETRYKEIADERTTRLGNIEQVAAIDEVPQDSVDFAFTALNFHDFHNSDPTRAQDLLGQVMAVLKSGGILGVVDHEGTPGADNTALHRIAYDDAVTAVTAAGFTFVEGSDVLDNPADDHTKGPFDESLGRNTDRIVLKFVKQ